MINKKEGIASKYDAKVKQGFIFVKKKSSWIRRWLVVSGGFLFIYKGWKVPLIPSLFLPLFLFNLFYSGTLKINI